MSTNEKLEQLNNRFIEIYEATRGALIQGQKERVLIVVHGDELLLFRGADTPEVIAGLRPPAYMSLRALAHVPLAIYCLLTLDAGKPSISSSTLADLTDYGRQIEACAATFDIRGFVERGQLGRPVTTVDRALAFVDAVLNRQRIDVAALDEFAASMAEDILLLVTAAGTAQLNALHERILHLKNTVLSQQDWKDLRVVVIGNHMAHKDDLFLQYFSRVLQTPKYTEKRLVYAENDDMDVALDVLGTTLIDFRVSRAFFGDENRMHRDVLADVTKRYLRELGADDHESR